MTKVRKRGKKINRVPSISSPQKFPFYRRCRSCRKKRRSSFTVVAVIVFDAVVVVVVIVVVVVVVAAVVAIGVVVVVVISLSIERSKKFKGNLLFAPLQRPTSFAQSKIFSLKKTQKNG